MQHFAFINKIMTFVYVSIPKRNLKQWPIVKCPDVHISKSAKFALIIK